MKNIFKKISKASILGIIMAVVFVASYVFASIPLGSNFQLNSQLPLDARTVVATLAARDAMPSGQRYQGLTVYVTANSTNYQLQGGILNTNWVAIGGGSTSETDPVFTASQAFSITGTDITHLSNLSGTNTGNQVGDGVTITGAGTIADPFVSHGGSGLIGSTSAITPGVSTETWLGTSVADMGTASTNNTVFIGIGAGKKGTNANYSNFIGYKAGGDSGLTTGAINAAYSNFIGYSAGKDSANAAHSIFIGTDAGLTDTVDNTVSGTSILIGDYTSTGGNKNSIAIGANATNTASNQFLIGSSYTQFNMRGVNYTMPSLQGGAGTVLANDGSGNLSWTPGGGGLIGSTSALGTETWLGTSIADMGTASHANTVFIGINAGKNATSATHSIFIGLTAGQSATNAAYSTFIGDTAGQSATNAAYSTFIGYGAGQSTTIAANSTFIGTTAGQNATVAQNSNFIGANSGQSATNAEDSTFIGFSAGNGATNAANSIFIGDTAGEYDNINNTVSGTSILIGNNTSTDGYQNSIAIGTNAISTATNQFLIDQTYTQFNMRGVNYTMPSLQGGVSTVLTNNGSGGLSWAAAGGLLGSTSTTGTETWLGTSIADMGTASTTNTMFIGIDAGQNATTADNSIFIGNNAGASDSVDNTVSGTSILIGNSTSTGGFQNSIAIGDSAINTATNQFLIGSSYTNINMGGIQIISGNILPTVASTVSDNITFVNTTGNVNAPSSLALGSDGYARIAYSDAESLKLAQCTNNDCITSNITSITPISVAANPSLSIALSSDGYARIAYFNVTNTDLKFAQCTNDDCTTKNITTVDSAGNVGQNPSLALGSDGYARISYADTTNGNLKFAQCTNADCTTKNIATVDSGGFNSSLALGSDSFARIAYIDALGGGNIKFAQCTNGACSAKNITTVDSIGAYIGQGVSLALGSDGYARIAYHNGTNGNLKFAQCTNADCTTKNITTIDSGSNAGSFPSLALGSDGYARIVDFDQTNSILKLIQCTNDACTTKNITTIDSGSGSGYYSSIAIGSDGYVRIAYSDFDTNGGIKLFRDTGAAPTFTTGSDIGSPTIPFSNIYAVDVFSKQSLVGYFDMAENYPTKDSNLSAGYIVSLDKDNPVFVKKALNTDRIIGIVSTMPGSLLGGYNDELYANENKVPIALSGRVPVKVGLENGPISQGDDISLSSTAGIGKKAKPGEDTVGIALESYDGTSSDNSILVFVHLQTSLSDLNLKVADLSSLDTTNATSLGSLIAEFLNDQIVMIKEATVGILHINGQVCVDDVCATKDEFKNLLLEAKGLPPLPILPSSSQTTATNPSDGTSSTPSDTTPPATSPDTTLPDTTPAVNAPAVSDPADVTTPPVPEIPAVPPADQTSAPQTATP